MNELASILNLIVDSIPPSQPLTLESIMACNEENFRREFEAEFGGTKGKEYFSIPELKQLMDNSEAWTTVNMETAKRVRLLHHILTFTQKPHLEMMDLNLFREIVTPEGLKLIMSKSFFVNYTLQMNQINKLTLLQGLYLRTFIKIHMHADMKFKAVIDSSMIDIDHPYIRQTIREENRKDNFLSEKYIQGLHVENLILRMIDDFFPGISGIWIDHNHLLPASVLQFTLECFEYGFISPPVARQILIKLTKATTHLIKLEEGWSDRLAEVNKFSDMIKANNITSLFAKNREIMALLLIQILVTISDSYFLATYDKYIHKVQASNALNPSKADEIEKHVESELVNEFPQGFAFYDKSVNDSVLYITMNYLSETVYLSDQRGMSANSKVAVEKLFLYITSTGRDVFLNSLKGVDNKDLRYFSTTDVVAKSTRDHCDKLGATLRELLRMISMQMFDRITGALSKDFQIPKDKEDSLLLHVYIPTEAPTLLDIVQKILQSIERDINKDESLAMDVKVALVKESVPLALLSIADYISEFFGNDVQSAKKAIIDTLIFISKDNNYCKGQLFKSDGCYHILRLMRRFDHNVFLLLAELCNETNITNYVCNEFYTEFIKVYIEVEDKIRMFMPNYLQWGINQIQEHDSDPSKKLPFLEKKAQEFRKIINGEPAHLDLRLGVIFILMNKVISKTYRKEFLNELEKLQGAFQTQEVIYQSLAEVYIPHMVDLLQNTDFTYMQNIPKRFARLDFIDGRESQLIESLEITLKKSVNTEIDEKVREDIKQRMILEFYICFSTMRAFNTTAVDCTSSVVQKAMNDAGLIEKLKYCVFNDNPEGKKVQRKVSVIPQNLEIEVITFLRVMDIFKEQNCLMEGHFNPNNTDRVRFKENNAEPDRLSKTDLLLRCISHTDSYLPDTDEAKSYIYEGLLPLVYDTMKTFQNLSNYDKQGGASLILKIRNELSTNLNVFNEIACGKGKAALDGVKFGILMPDDPEGKRRPRSGLRKKSQDKLATTSPTPAQAEQKNEAKSDKKKESKNETLLKACCDSIKEFLDAFYKVADPAHQSIYEGMHDITHDAYEAQTYNVKFDSGEELDNDRSLRKRILNLFLKTYQKEKENYFERSQEPNLSSYFDRNSQNLRGLFNSCLDRLLNQTKFERVAIKSKLTVDYAVSRFWMSRSCFPYLKMLERLLTKSKTCRKEFFAYFREYEACERQTLKKEPEEISKKEKREWLNTLEKMKKAAGNRRRDDFFGVLCRIHCDLLMYLNDSATQNLQWWVVHQTYETISNFFKNLCECNFKEFKEFFSLYVPPAKDLGWRDEIRGAPLMLIFAQELNYLQLTSRVSRNKESMMVFSDMIEKIHPLLQPLLNLVNEAVTGPCTTNQQILLDQRVQKFILSPAGQKLLRPVFSMKTNMDPVVQKILLDVKAQKALDTQGRDNISQNENQAESKRQIEGKNGAEGQTQQNTFQSPLIDAMVSLPMRLVDEMDGEFAELAVASLNLLLSCLEGSGELNAKIIKSFATKVHPAVLEDRITRLMKKIYIQELIKSNKFEKEARKKHKKEQQNLEELKRLDPTYMEKKMAEDDPKDISKFSMQSGFENLSFDEKVAAVLKMNSNPDEHPVITADAEQMVEIEDWEDLYDLYMKQPELSDSQQFHFIFKLMILWQTLTKHSRTHKIRLEDSRKEAVELFEKESSFSLDPTLLLKEKKAVSEFSCVFYFISCKIMTEIEIVDTEKTPVLIYFPRAPPTFMLSDEAKTSYREECDITDSNTKMLNLMRNYNLFKILMLSDLKTWRYMRFTFKALSADAFNRYTFFCWLLGFIINVITLATTVYDADSSSVVYRNTDSELAVRIMSYILVGISSLFLFVWLIFKYSQTYKTNLEDYLFDNPESKATSWSVILYVSIYKAFMQQPFPMNYTLHILFTVVGVEYSLLALGFNLLLIINISKTTKFVLTSIVLHIDQLVLTLILAIFMIYSYSHIIGNYFQGELGDSDAPQCDTLIHCFFFTFNLGLRNGGGIAESLKGVDTDRGYGMVGNRTGLDISFFLLINVISLNIIFGIIIDTFSQLRDSQNERTSDKKNNCFVCGNTRLDFSKAGINFDNHIEDKHDAWKYIYYILYLEYKGESELSGLEYFVWGQIQAKKTNWIPIGNTLTISSESDEQLKSIEQKISNLEVVVKDIGANMNSLSKETTEFLAGLGPRHSRSHHHFQAGGAAAIASTRVKGF